MINNKKINLFLMLSVILFSLIGTTGCTTDDLGNPDHIAGPGSNPVKYWSYTNYISFENHIKNINMNNCSIVSFDLDNISDVGEKEYYYETFLEYNGKEVVNFYHYFAYTFYSKYDPINQDVDKLHYKIKCYDISLINDYTETNFLFKLISEENTKLTYDLLLNEECVMKIELDMNENYTTTDVEYVIKLLENNIVILQGGQ